MRDLDSFTEGTGCGSFEDLPTAGTDELGELIHHVTPSAVSLLPPPESLRAFIVKWQEAICDSEERESEPVPMKRHRSPSPEEEHFVRRIRPRTRAISLPGNFKAFTQFLGYPTTRSEPEAPD